MQMLEFIKENSEKFEFQQNETEWVLVAENKNKIASMRDFCVDILQKGKLRKPNTDNFYTEKFTEGEIVFLTKYFSANGFYMKRRDTKLEEKLKESLIILTKNNPNDISELVESLTYHDQLLMADKIANHK
jgi:hypothetical protein